MLENIRKTGKPNCLKHMKSVKLELRYILCNVCFFRDWKLIVQKEQNKSARALPESGVNTTHAQENGQRLPVHKGDGAQGSLVYDDPVATNDHGASNGNCYYGKLIWWGTCSEERIFLDLPDIWLVLILFSYFANYLQVFSSHCMWYFITLYVIMRLSKIFLYLQ